MEWLYSILPMGLFVIALLTIFFNQGSKYLSIREHESYQAFVTRELDYLRGRITILEATRPTTGEIAAKLDNRNREIKQCQKLP
jgi:hypothetical protein